MRSKDITIGQVYGYRSYPTAQVKPVRVLALKQPRKVYSNSGRFSLSGHTNNDGITVERVTTGIVETVIARQLEPLEQAVEADHARQDRRLAAQGMNEAFKDLANQLEQVLGSTVLMTGYRSDTYGEFMLDKVNLSRMQVEQLLALLKDEE